MSAHPSMLILGAGYTGLRLAQAALKRGLKVTGTSRAAATLDALARQGAGAMRFDLVQPDWQALAAHMGPQTTLVYSAPTLHGSLPAGADHARPMRELVRLARRVGLRRLIYLSSTSVYGDHEGAWIDERTSARPRSPLGKMRRELELEALALVTHAPVSIARIVGIYGPGRTLLDYLQRGRYSLVDGGYKHTNRIHVDDLVESILAIAERGSPGGRLYNIADGNPLMVRELVSYLVTQLGMDWPLEESLEQYARRAGPHAAARWESEYLCSNARLRQELGVVLRYPDALRGYEAMIARGELRLYGEDSSELALD